MYSKQPKRLVRNVRVTFTTKPQTTSSKTTNFEEDTEDDDRAYFKNYSSSTYDLVDHTDAGGAYQKVQWLNGGVNGRVGLAKSYSVMPGDRVSIAAYAKYMNLGQTPNTAPLITSLAAAFGVSSSSTGEELKLYNGLNSFAATVPEGDHDAYEPDDDTAPKAFVTIIFLDRNYNLLDAAWDQIETDDGAQTSPSVKQPPHDELSVTAIAKEPGFAYIFVSNEHPTAVDVYFDDVTMTHVPSQIISSSDYYPFGLTFNSGEREGSIEQKILFQGQELQDELSLGWYHFKWRMHDPTIARFFCVDPLSEEFYYNSPYAFSENRVIDGREIEGLEWQPVNDNWEPVIKGAETHTGYTWVGFNEDGSAPEGTVADAIIWNSSETGGTFYGVDDRTKGPKIAYAEITHQGTLNQIATLDANMQKPAKELILRANFELNLEVRVTQGLRTIEQQNNLYAQGRTQAQLNRVGLTNVRAQPNAPRVTNARGGQSLHNYGVAFDVVPIRNGVADWNSNQWNDLGALGVRLGLFWGGNWTTFTDLPHFDNGQTLGQLQQQNPTR